MFSVARFLRRRRMAGDCRHVPRTDVSYAFDPQETPPSNEDYRRLLDEVTLLRRKRAQIGMAIVVGEIDRPLCAELRAAVEKLADYVSYAGWGPVLVVAFQRSLFEQLKPLWRELLAGVPGISAGVAFPDDEDMTTQDLVLAARLALVRALDSHCGLVAFDEEDAMAAVAAFRQDRDAARLTASYPCNAEALT